MSSDISFADRLNRAWARTQFTSRQRVRIYGKLASLLEKGVPIARAVETITTIASRGDPESSEPIVIVMRDIRAAISQGKRISDILSEWNVPSAEVMVIAAGETGGTLPHSLRNAARIATTAGEMKGALIGALAYPLMLFMAAIGVILLYGLVVIPEFQRSVPGIVWRGVAASVIVMSEFVSSPYLIVLVVFAVAMAWLVAWSCPNFDGAPRKILDKLPPWSLYRLAVGSAWLIGLGALVEAGMRLENALTTMSGYSKPWLQNRIAETLAGLRAGKNLGEALAHGGHEFPDREIAEDLTVYSSLGGVDKALVTLADEWIKRGAESVRNSAGVLNVIAILSMAGIVAWLIGGLFDMQQQIQLATKAAASGVVR